MDKFLTTNDAAKYLGVSRSSLSNWIRQGLLKGGVTPGGHYRFTLEELDDFARQRGLTPAENPAAANEPAKILLVDDDEAFREFVTDALTVFSGYEIREAEDGMKGALMIGSWKPDLVILDVRMPRMDGRELLRLIRAETTDMPVIIASAHLSEELTTDLQTMQPEIILEKPVHLAKLIAAIQKILDLQLA